MSDRLRAPAEHGAVLIDPPPEQVSALLERASHFDLSSAKFHKLSFREWRDLARQEVCAQSNGPWLVAGHQPGLFHPGVWVKNFVLAALAKRHGGCALNLVVDNDTLKQRSIRVPVWRGPKSLPEEIHSMAVPFDQASGEVPFEDAIVHDEATFDDFSRRITALTADWPEPPIASDYWRRALQVDTKLIADRLITARLELEREWGVHNYEVPVSRLSGGRSFACFVHALLTQLPKFHTIYNRRVQDYRVLHRIRSGNHPVPDLSKNGEFLESPFWAWQTGDSRRGRLFARCHSDRVELRTDAGQSASISLSRFEDDWLALQGSVFKVRPRALTTTIFARLALAGVFIHGIGGAIYDRLADVICSDFFGAPPPPFMVVSGTLRLPLTVDSPRRNAVSTRDLTWKPHQFLDGDQSVSALIAERRKLISELPTDRRTRRGRFHALRDNLDKLAPFVATMIEESRQLEVDAAAREHANAILSSRDYSFMLYSERELRRFFKHATDQVTS